LFAFAYGFGLTRRQGERAEARKSVGGVGYGEFRLDTPLLAAGSFIIGSLRKIVPGTSITPFLKTHGVFCCQYWIKTQT
jgi:hypothetical protein